MRRPATFALIVALALSMLGCGSNGRDLRQPEAGAVSPTRSTPSTSAGSVAASPSLNLTLKSRAFTAGGTIPAAYSCNGESPDLAWTGVPAGTAELALAVVDPDADRFVHWMVTGIRANDGTIPAGRPPPEATVLPNGTGTAGWYGPCPPAGTQHSYNFILFALPEPSAIPAGTPPRDALEALQNDARGRLTILTGTFGS
jgi:Raf kinase inhibitor-like YbhB/YbcL family protein